MNDNFALKQLSCTQNFDEKDHTAMTFQLLKLHRITMLASVSIHMSNRSVSQNMMPYHDQALGVQLPDGELKNVNFHLPFNVIIFVTFDHFPFLAEDNKSLAPVLQAAAVPLLDMETCRMSGVNRGRSQNILDTMICAGEYS